MAISFQYDGQSYMKSIQAIVALKDLGPGMKEQQFTGNACQWKSLLAYELLNGVALEVIHQNDSRT